MMLPTIEIWLSKYVMPLEKNQKAYYSHHLLAGRNRRRELKID